MLTFLQMGLSVCTKGYLGTFLLFSSYPQLFGGTYDMRLFYHRESEGLNYGMFMVFTEPYVFIDRVLSFYYQLKTIFSQV